MSIRSILFISIFVLLAAGAGAARYTVTTTADGGPGSFRAALEAVNSGECARPCSVNFAIPAPVPASGYFTIRPLSPLPVLFGDEVTIDGSTQAALTGDTNREGPEIELDGSSAGYRSGIKLGRVVGMTIRGLAVNRFEGHGIFVDNSSRVKIHDCYIGVDPTGRHALGNGLDGLAFRGVYGQAEIRDNVIGGNRSNGIYIAGFFDFTIARNRIGAGRDGSAIGNGANGIDIGVRDAVIWDNEIAHNAHYGVVVDDASYGVRIYSNSVHSNGLMSLGLGHDALDTADPLDADGGANGRVNSPVLTSARADASLPGYYTGRIEYTGTIRGKPETGFWIEAYASPRLGPLGFAEAKLSIGRTYVATDAEGNASFALERGYGDSAEFLLVPGGWLAATATSEEGTSELGNAVPISATYIDVTTVADSGPGSLRDAIVRANASDCSEQAPCWITFDVPPGELRNGVAVIEPLSPLPAITRAYIHIDGGSQSWRHGDTNPRGPEVEIRGTHAGAEAGLRGGSASEPLDEIFIHALAVTGFNGDGVSIDSKASSSYYEGADIRLSALIVGLDPATEAPRGNSGDGISIRGGRTGEAQAYWMLRDSTIGSNEGNGVRLQASGSSVESCRIGIANDGTARPNGGAGVLVDGGAFEVSVRSSTIAFNRRAGVATAPDARAVFVDALFHSNALLGIDRNDDGLGGGAAQGVTPRPTLHSATFDAAKNATVLEGELGEGTPILGLPAGSGNEMQLRFYVSVSRDPSGFGEGAGHATGPGAYPLEFDGREFRAELPGDFRGRYLTATQSYAVCFWEFGCHGRDTSEFSNAVLVK